MKSTFRARVRIAATLSAVFGFASAPGLGAQVPAVLDSLVADMEMVFSESSGTVDHTMTVYGYALEIHQEEGGDPTVVGASAILHDIGILRAREVHGSGAGPFQEIEGPPIARQILSKHELPAAAIDHICGIVANHHSDQDPEIVGTIEFKIVWDADWLVNFPRRYSGNTNQDKEMAIEEIFKTKKGRELARQMFLERP